MILIASALVYTYYIKRKLLPGADVPPITERLTARSALVKDGTDDFGFGVGGDVDPSRSAVRREQVGEIGRSGASLGVVWAVLFGIRLFTPLEVSWVDLLRRLVENMADDWITQSVRNMVTSTGLVACPSLLNSNLKEALEMKDDYEANKKPKLTKTMQVFIEDCMAGQIREMTGYSGRPSSTMKAVLDELMQLPVDVAPSQVDEDAFNDFLSFYPKEIRQDIAVLVASLVQTAEAEELTKKPAPLMFVGPPGTGKTYLANRISLLTGIPVKSVDLSRYASSKTLEGDQVRFGFNPNRGILADILLDTCGMDENCTNKIVLLDEVDKVLSLDKHGLSDAYIIVRFLLELFEQSNTSMPVKRYDDSMVDISRLQFIVIANRTFTESLGEDIAAPLENHVKVVKFDRGYNAAQKRRIVKEHLDQVVTTASEKKVNSDMIERLINKDEDLGHRGVRTLLRVVDEYVDTMRHSEQVSRLLGQEPTFSVEDAFRSQRMGLSDINLRNSGMYS